MNERRATELSWRSPFFLRINLPRTAVEDRSDHDGDGVPDGTDNWPPVANPGQLDGDCDVDLADLAALLAVYGTCEGDPNYNAAADLDDSGCVELSDLATLLANYGTSCP